MNMGQKTRKLFLASRGSVIIEYAIILPALLLFVLGILDIGRFVWTQTTLDRAAEAAARCGAVNTLTCGSASAIQNYAVTQTYGLNVTASAFTASTASCGLKVTASLPFVFVIPFMTTSNITLVATACYPT
jgi:Flp pilus assembly protein TadG